MMRSTYPMRRTPLAERRPMTIRMTTCIVYIGGFLSSGMGYAAGDTNRAVSTSKPVVTAQPASSIAQGDRPPTASGACATEIQGKIAWDYKGSTDWAPANIKRLCKGAEGSVEPARCFQRVMHGGIDWGGGTRWEWKNAIDLCEGSQDAAKTIRCFRNEIKRGRTWRSAISWCEKTAAARPEGPGPGVSTLPTKPALESELSQLRTSSGTRDALLRTFQSNYRLYAMRTDGSVARATWTGTIALPDLGAEASRVIVRVGDRRSPKHGFWYQRADRSLSRYIRSSDGRSFGMVTVTPRGTLQIAVDLEGDRVVDVLYSSGPNQATLVFAREATALRFLDGLLGRGNPFCGVPAPTGAGATVTLDRLSDGTPLRTFNSCSGAASSGGSVSPWTPGGSGKHDPIDAACSALAASPRGSSLPDAVRDDWFIDTLVTLATEYGPKAAAWVANEAFLRGFIEMDAALAAEATLATAAEWANPIGAFLVVTLDASTAQASPCELGPPGTCAAQAEARRTQEAATGGGPVSPPPPSTGGTRSSDTDDDEDDTSTAGGGTSDSPVIGEDGRIKGLAQLCELRRQSRTSRAPQSLAELDRRAVKSNCRGPVEASERTSAKEIDCEPETERRTLEEARSVFNGTGAGNDCRSNERPGPDGTCRGRRPVTSLGQRGRIGVAFGGLVGIEICDPIVCNPGAR